MKTTTWISLGLAIGGTIGACYRHDPTYCGNLNGHESCRYLGLGQYCSLCDFEKDGCVDSRPSDECLAPFEIPMETEGSTGSSGSNTAGQTVSSGAEPGSESSGSSSSGELACMSSEDCSGDTPICGPKGECVRCDAVGDPDGACTEVDWRAPLCVDGRCVACTAEDTTICDGQLRICEPVSNTCVDCTEHTQCGAGACRLDEGLCFPPDQVVHVDGDGEQDYMTVNEAIASFNDGALGVVVLHERVGLAPYTEPVFVGSSKILALIPAPGEAPSILGTGGSAGITVQDAGSTLYLDDLRVAGGDGSGISCNGARADLRRSRIVQNASGGVLAQASCELSIENSFIGGTIDNDALYVQSSTASVLYSTVAASARIAASPAAVRCDGASTVDVRNAILVGASDEPEVQCAGASVTNSASEADQSGSGNTAVGALDVTWFEDFVAGDFSLSSVGGTVFEGIAQWEIEDPPTDIDGDARPMVDGTADYPGADLP
ncbi:MAG: right-handed parallel beta-helix repeat-containing protein [Myxococcota bacterium]